MTTNTDAQIAREWARRAVESAENAQPVSRGALAAARHVLATTTPPTMADIAWDDEVHAGLCAEHCDGDVRMIGPDPDNEGVIFCHYINAFGPPVTGGLSAENLTPIPGTKIDLTPRRESTTPDHPVTLSSVEDYDDAPVGTVVADDDDVAMKRDTGRWYWAWKNGAFWAEDLADVDVDPCTVVRWGK